MLRGRKRRREIIAELERLMAAERNPARVRYLADLVLYAEVGRERNKLPPTYIADGLRVFDEMFASRRATLSAQAIERDEAPAPEVVELEAEVSE